MGVLDHECCHIISFISWPVMVDIDAEMHGNVLTFLKEWTSNWFFFLNHNSALNKGILICANLIFDFVLSKKSMGLGSGGGKSSCALAYKELKLFREFLNPVFCCWWLMRKMVVSHVKSKYKKVMGEANTQENMPGGISFCALAQYIDTQVWKVCFEN